MASPVTKIAPHKVKQFPFLVNAIRHKVDQTNIPLYALLLGAGCSVACGIPVGRDVIELCRMHAFVNDEIADAATLLAGCDNRFDKGELKAHLESLGHEQAFHTYLEKMSVRMKEEVGLHQKAYLDRIVTMMGESAVAPVWEDYEEAIVSDYAYGFWINALSESGQVRQRFIEELMQEKQPDGAYILLSYLVSQRTFSNVLTTNFDDLINDALIYYTGTQCRFFADDELSKYISIHSNKPNIIKLHGDFRFANMSNTNEETSSLSPNLRNKLVQLLGQLGLIVIGYNGADHSIMSVLYELKRQEGDYPLIWCGMDPNQVHWRVAQLINNTSDSYFVVIENFAQLTGQLAAQFLDNKIEQNNIVTAAKKRQEQVELTLRQFNLNFKESSASKEEKEKLDKTLTSLDYTQQAYEAIDPIVKIELYSKAIELDRKSVLAYNNRGSAYNDLEKYENALADCTKAIELDEKLAAAYNNRGFAYSNLEEKEKAINDFSKAIELDEKDSVVYINRGNVYMDIKEYEEALADFNKAIELDRKSARGYCDRGNLYNNLKEYEKAEADLTKAIDLDGKSDTAYNNRAYSYNNLKEYERAIVDATKAIELNEKFANPYRHRGRAYSNLNEHEKAIADFTKAIELNESYALAYADRAEAYQALGQDDKANVDFAKAKELETHQKST